MNFFGVVQSEDTPWLTRVKSSNAMFCIDQNLAVAEVTELIRNGADFDGERVALQNFNKPWHSGLNVFCTPDGDKDLPLAFARRLNELSQEAASLKRFELHPR